MKLCYSNEYLHKTIELKIGSNYNNNALNFTNFVIKLTR